MMKHTLWNSAILCLIDDIYTARETTYVELTAEELGFDGILFPWNNYNCHWPPWWSSIVISGGRR